MSPVIALVILFVIGAAAFAVYWFVFNKKNESTDTSAPEEPVRYRILNNGTVQRIEDPETFVATLNKPNVCGETYCDHKPIYYILEHPTGEVPLHEVQLIHYPGLVLYLADESGDIALPPSMGTLPPWDETLPPLCSTETQKGCREEDSRRVVEMMNALFSTDNIHAEANIRVARREIQNYLQINKLIWDDFLDKFVQIDDNQQVVVDYWYRAKTIHDDVPEITDPSMRKLLQVPMRFVSDDTHPANAMIPMILFLYLQDPENPIAPIEVPENAMIVEDTVPTIQNQWNQEMTAASAYMACYGTAEPSSCCAKKTEMISTERYDDGAIAFFTKNQCIG